MASAWTGPPARRSRIQLVFSRGARIGIPPPHKPMLGLILAWTRLREQACCEGVCGTGWCSKCGDTGIVSGPNLFEVITIYGILTNGVSFLKTIHKHRTVTTTSLDSHHSLRT